MDQKVLQCEMCAASIMVDEEYYSVKVQLEKSDAKFKIFRGEEFPLYSLCAKCAQDVLLKGLVLSKDNRVSISTDDNNENE